MTASSTAQVVSDFPTAPLDYLETLWFQVAGTLCNLQCRHCLVSASPTNRTHEHMSLAEIRPILQEADRLGVREYYFTGGEPFMNREMPAIIEETLRYGPVNVLTNGVLIDAALATRLKALSDASRYTLDLRISIDGTTAETNDPIRGAGTFARILRGIENLAKVGLNPVLTVTEAAPELEVVGRGREKFYELLRSIGIAQPRIKILSLFHIGEEESRSNAYRSGDTLRGLHLNREDLEKLQCTTSRLVAHEGVYVCPILVNDPRGRMGSHLSESFRSFPLTTGACFTCYKFGVTCRN